MRATKVSRHDMERLFPCDSLTRHSRNQEGCLGLRLQTPGTRSSLPECPSLALLRRKGIAILFAWGLKPEVFANPNEISRRRD